MGRAVDQTNYAAEISSMDMNVAADRRLAVFEMAGTEKAFLATVSVVRGGDGHWAFQCGGSTEVGIARIRPLLERYGAERRVAGNAGVTKSSSVAPPDLDAVIALLRQDGFIVEELPAGDYQIEFQLDFGNRILVGTQEAMHDLADSDSPIGRQLVETLAKGFARASEDLADEIEALIGRTEIAAAAQALKREVDRGMFWLPLSDKLLRALDRLDVSILSPDDRQTVRKARLAVAHHLGRFDIAGAEADAMLGEDGATFSPEKIATLKMTVALGAIKRDHRETGLAMLRDLPEAPTALDAEGRGWAWRNISMALESNDPEARRAAQLSADAFLQSGNKTEAAKSLMQLANFPMQEDPGKAVRVLNEMIAVLDKEGIVNRYGRAAALHARANRFAILNRHSDAYQDACESVKLRRGLLGAEGEFVSSLHLAALEACHVGDETAAEAFETEAEKLTDEWKLPQFQLAQRVSRLAQAFHPNEAEKLVDEAEVAHNLEVIVAVRILQASLDTSLSDTARLEILEKTRNRITAANGRAASLKPIQIAMAQRLAGMGQYQRAETWLREILAADLFDGFARNALIDCLWRQEKWGDAAIFVRKQLALRGELPGLTFALGRSLFEAGDLSGAVMTLTRLLAALGGDDNLRNHATELRERALQLGGTIEPARPPAPITGPVTREELEAALDSFARFIAAEKRMRFWVSNKKGGHEWVKKPERLAQDLLHTFLKARFDERVEIFEEIATGAGRLDLYARLEGGLSVIIELKMCGAPYSSAYAAVGEDKFTTTWTIARPILAIWSCSMRGSTCLASGSLHNRLVHTRWSGKSSMFAIA